MGCHGSQTDVLGLTGVALLGTLITAVKPLQYGGICRLVIPWLTWRTNWSKSGSRANIAQIDMLGKTWENGLVNGLVAETNGLYLKGRAFPISP